MGKRRTKFEKLRAQLHKSQIAPHPSTQSSGQRFGQAKQKSDISLNRDAFYTPTLELPMEMLKKDLTKTLAVTILAVILQMSLAYYLNHGGWRIVNSLIINKLMSSS